jgi:hypothetical protein
MSLCCEWCALSGRCPCDHSPRGPTECEVSERHLETSTMRRPRRTRGSSHGKKVGGRQVVRPPREAE